MLPSSPFIDVIGMVVTQYTPALVQVCGALDSWIELEHVSEVIIELLLLFSSSVYEASFYAVFEALSA
jgi:hypothetical protein